MSIFRTLFNKGSRVPIRGKVNEALTTGVRVVDTILLIGRSQRRLIKHYRINFNINEDPWS